jgi:rhamnosyl/mannosyltransferase
MKIAQIVCSYPPYKSGIGNSASWLQGVFSKHHSSHVFTADTDNHARLNKEQETGIIRLKPWLKSGLGAWLPQLSWKLAKEDLIYFHYPYFGTEISILFAAFILRKRLIVHYHMDVTWPGSLKGLLVKILNPIINILFARAEKIVVASLDYAKEGRLANLYEKHPEKFAIIPFPADTSRFHPQRDKSMSPAPKIIFVGGLDQTHYFKGVPILLEALALNKDLDWKLQIVGDGNLRSEYEKIAKDLGIAERINFLGRISDDELPTAYRESDIFVLPSINKNEAFGIVLLEAMSSGLPLIASSLPGVRTVFNCGKEGLYAEPGNKHDLAEKLKTLISDQNLRQSMGQAARKLAEDKYSLEKINNQILEAIKA